MNGSAVRTRRQILAGRIGTPIHIASLLVQAWPERLSEITIAVAGMAGAEAHETEAPGRLIVSLEVESDSDLVDTMAEIGEIEGVISTSLVYHQVEASSDDE
jgi:nitrate reductase NapD